MDDTFARMTGVTARYDQVTALDAADLDLPEGRIVALCGPNGSGKSTALRVLRGLHAADSGEVRVAGRPLADWTPRALARAVAMLSQSPQAPPELTVADLVRLGRFAHRGRFGGRGPADAAACDHALAATAMTDLADRPIGALSGGQLQRAWIAMTLAQQAPRLFLDEPTNHLDLAHAFDVLDLVRRLNRDEGRGVVLVMHDLNMAMRYADHVALFRHGRVVAAGPTRAVMTEARLSEVFGLRCRIVDLPGETAPLLVPRPDGGGCA